MLDCAIQCATHISLTWSNPNVWQCDVIPIRPFLDNHDGISLCSPICARIICILAFRPSHQTACSRTGSRPLWRQILRIYPKQRSDGQTTFFHKRSFPFSSFFHLLIPSIDSAPLSLQHHSPPFPHRELWCVADEAQNRLQGRHNSDEVGWGWGRMLLRTKIALLSKPPRHGNQSNSPQACWNWEAIQDLASASNYPFLKPVWHTKKTVWEMFETRFLHWILVPTHNFLQIFVW